MKRITFTSNGSFLIIVVLAAALGLVAVRPSAVEESASAESTPAGQKAPDAASLGDVPPFPKGFDWPANPSVLNAAIQRRDWATLRKHGWWLWAGLNTTTAGGNPLWWSWPTASQAFPPSAETLRAVNAANTPINLHGPWYPVPKVVNGTCQTGTTSGLPDGYRFQSNGDIMIVDVVYNKDVFEWIGKDNVNQASALDARWKNGDKNIKPFPSNSIVLKHMYWPAKDDGYTPLPVWDPAYYPSQPAYVGYEFWKRAVAIDPTGLPVPPNKSVPVEYLFHILRSETIRAPLPTVKTNAKVVSINAFYHHRVTGEELKAMSANDLAIVNAAACWLYDRPFQANDYLVSIAMHINTREIDTWTLQSLWWHDKPNAGPSAENRPDIPQTKVRGPWRHYLMTIEYGIEAKPGVLPVAYNPYIELAAGHPIQTNCRNCHTRAAWPRGFNPPRPPPTASYLAPNGPDALANLKPTDKIFNGLMRMDFQWSASNRAK